MPAALQPSQEVEKQREEELQRARRLKEEVEKQKEEARRKKARAEVGMVCNPQCLGVCEAPALCLLHCVRLRCPYHPVAACMLVCVHVGPIPGWQELAAERRRLEHEARVQAEEEARAATEERVRSASSDPL